MAQPFRAPLATIVDTVQPSAVQSASIVCEVAEKLERWIRIKQPSEVVVPSVQDISLTQGGSVWWCRGRAVPAERVIPALGALLESLIREASALRRTPAGLLYVMARATDPRHLAPFDTLNDFRVTVARYAALHRPSAVDALLAQYTMARSGLPPLRPDSSISDIRRLRRAGGISLKQIAEDTGIPISLLRELEWGVYLNWQMEHARGALAAYAERAGLNAEAVVHVVAREQSRVLPAPVEPPATTPAPARTLAETMVPFALAVMLLGAVVVATPGDRPAQVREVTTAATAPAQPPARTPAVVPVSDQPANPAPARPLVATAGGSPRRARRPDAPPRRTPVRTLASAAETSRRADAQHPLVRFAQTIAGDGRYKVEPFPKPR